MVNTRRSETVGSTPEKSSNQHRTRRRVVTVQDSGRSPTTSSLSSSSSSSSSSTSSEDETKDHGNDSSLDERGKSKLIKKDDGPISSKVRELRNRFVYNERKYSSRIQSENRVKNRKRLLNEKRSLAVYSRNMHQDFDMMFDDNDSDDEVYSRSRRSRHLRARLARRTALSLRPIVQKCYADPLSPLFNSECDSGVRRSKRQRKVQFDNMSWLADDQMHKDGYPNLNTSGYSDDDSRDAQETLTETSRRTTRQVKNPKYLYDYETKISPKSRRNNDTNMLEHKKNNLKTRRESNDKENKQQTTNINGRSHSRRNKKTDGDEDDDDDDDDDEDIGGDDDDVDDDDDDDGEINVDGEVDENKKQPEVCEGNSNDTEKITQENGVTNMKTKPVKPNVGKKDTSDSDESPKLRTQTKRNNLLMNRNFRSRRTKNRRDLEDTDDTEESNRKYRYSLRTRQPKDVPPSSYELSIRSRHHHNRRRNVPSSSSDSSTDDDVAYSKNQKDKKNLKNEQKMRSGAGGNKIIPIGPETLDTKIRFNSIGGLENHIQCLKEMVLLPMMYPEVFRQFQIQPPKGVLFHGPPGTGKTLLARALANECSLACRKVSFFMRKGADLLSKWIGESERQLRLLFEQAAEMQPSIIFFDELDGLAPVRSSRQDQVHASIVSTLLALMDGLDNRGEVIVIGATNRIDAIDPALRRPGRFDRELYFSLPAKQEREEILKVHVSQWKKPPNNELLSYLAENAVGYCGSDLRALCSEAVIHSFRRAYPQVYNCDHRLLLNPETVQVEKVDFLKAKSLLVPSSHRITLGLGKKLIPILEPLLNDPLNHIFTTLKTTFPHAINPTLSKVKLSSNLKPAQLLLIGENSDCGQTTHLAPAVLYRMEHIHTYILDLATLYNESGRTPEEICIQVFNEARRNIPSVIYIPNIDNLWSLINDVVKSIFETQVANLGTHIPILLLSTANTRYDNLPNEIQSMFSRYRKEVYELDLPNESYRKQFFKPLLIDTSLKPPRPQRKRPTTPPPLPKAPTPPPTPMTEEQKRKLYEEEEHTLRELRIFLRDMCKKLANNKLFYMFTKPVDTDTVPDYTTIIKQPMDLETMMTKVDFHRYECAKDFLEDIELICRNALEYNPAKTSADKQIRHRACSLRDYAYTLIKSEMDSDFEDKCQEIAQKRQQRKASIQKYLPPYIQTPENIGLLKNDDDDKEEKQNQQQPQQQRHVEDKSNEKEEKSDNQQECSNFIISRPTKKRKHSKWQNGIIRKKRRKETVTTIQENENENDNYKASSDERNNLPTPLSEVVNSSVEDILNKTIETSKPLTINCDISMEKLGPTSSQSPTRRLIDLMSPSELLEQPLEVDDIDQALNETIDEGAAFVTPVECNIDELQEVLKQTVKLTCGCSLQTLLDLYNQLSEIIRKFSNTHLRNSLPKELSKELMRFRNEVCSEGLSERCPSASSHHS